MSDDAFEYTEAFEQDLDFNSSVIDGIYYNSNNNQVCLDINDELYVYEVNSRDDVTELVNAESLGTYYNKRFKHIFGPGRYIGKWSLKLLDRVDVIEPSHEDPTKFINIAGDGSVFITNGVLPSSEINSSVITFNPNRRHEVVFTVEDGTVEKTATFTVNSVPAAVAELGNLAKMLDIKFNVKRVTVFYE